MTPSLDYYGYWIDKNDLLILNETTVEDMIVRTYFIPKETYMIRGTKLINPDESLPYVYIAEEKMIPVKMQNYIIGFKYEVELLQISFLQYIIPASGLFIIPIS